MTVKLINNLETLKLKKTIENLDLFTDKVNKNELTFSEALLELTDLELKYKDEMAVVACVRVGNFPHFKTVHDFDFSFQPSINKKEILELSTLSFIERQENVLFVGTPGTGKTHLATSLGVAAATKRYSTYFISFQELMSQLKKASYENRLERRLKFFGKYKVLIIDELGYQEMDTEAANLFFQLVSIRYEKHSTIITTNTPFSKWTDIFKNTTLTNALLDRLLHHSKVIKINGPSYRMKEKLAELNEEDMDKSIK